MVVRERGGNAPQMVNTARVRPYRCTADVPGRHWPLGLIYDNHTISASVRSTTPAAVPGSHSTISSTPLRLILHLASPPTDRLLLSPSTDACKQAFMGQLKEADFMRWGNTKRMTGLRKAEQDGMWEGVKDRESIFLRQ